jgi:ABC-type transport system involved in multi-copper enzyme maturation permease subunit
VIAVLRYEWVRITTVRSTRIMLVMTLLIAVGVGFLAGLPQDAYDQNGNQVAVPPDWYAAFGTLPMVIAAIFASVMAAQSIGQEYRFGIIRLTLTAFPKRVQVLMAKLTLVVVASLGVALLWIFGAWLGLVLHGLPTPPEGIPAPDSTFFLRGVLVVVLWALSAFALAGITRQTAIGIAVPLISGLVVEQILGAILRERAAWLVRVLPWSTGMRWAEQPVSGDPSAGGGGTGFGLEDLPVAWGAVGIFALWVVVLLGIQAMSFLQRDA